MPFAGWITKRSTANAGGIGKELIGTALTKALMEPIELQSEDEKDAARKAKSAAKTQVLDIFLPVRIATQETPKAGAVKEVLGRPGILASTTVTEQLSTVPPSSAHAPTVQVYFVKYYRHRHHHTPILAALEGVDNNSVNITTSLCVIAMATARILMPNLPGAVTVTGRSAGARITAWAYLRRLILPVTAAEHCSYFQPAH